MNFVFLSPHFPPNYYQFCTHLNNLGVNVLGLADEPYDHLSEPLKTSLKEYYKVNNLHNYDELLRALGFLTYKYGKIDRIESLNEYWLETEAQLRTDFNIVGINNEQIQKVKRKSLMKEMFMKAGVPVARGKVVRSMGEARALIDETGFPVVAKPDVGVGAARTYKIHDPSELLVNNIYRVDEIVTPTGLPTMTPTITLTPTRTPVPSATPRFTTTPVTPAPSNTAAP